MDVLLVSGHVIERKLLAPHSGGFSAFLLTVFLIVV